MNQPYDPLNVLTFKVYFDDETWIGRLLGSGLDLADLDYAIEAGTWSRMCKLTAPVLQSTSQMGSSAASVLNVLKTLTEG